MNKLHQKEKEILLNYCFIIGLLVFISIIVLWTPTQYLIFQKSNITSNFLGMNGNPSKNNIFHFYLLSVYLLTNISCFIVFLYTVYYFKTYNYFHNKNLFKILYILSSAITILATIILFILNPKSTIYINDTRKQFSFVYPLIFPFLTIFFGFFITLYNHRLLPFMMCKNTSNNVVLKLQQQSKTNDKKIQKTKVTSKVNKVIPKKKTSQKTLKKKQRFQELEKFE